MMCTYMIVHNDCVILYRFSQENSNFLNDTSEEEGKLSSDENYSDNDKDKYDVIICL